ncbi:sulfatase-like hydrolase/transferase [Verrucomicrobia bacterium]|nr:sulfatase-like hydrolase/transferase [Verrucomicrobiota bacterium]
MPSLRLNDYLFITLLLGGLSLLDLGAGSDRPNILFAISDDQSFPHASVYGSRFVKTPAFDRIANEGVLFQQAFCAAPGCSPSRASILTGRNIWQNREAGTHASNFPADLKVFTRALEQKGGYQVGYTGKAWGPGNSAITGWSQNPVGKVYNQHKMDSPAGISGNDYAKNFETFLKDQQTSTKPFFFWFGAHEPHRVYKEGAGVKSGKRLNDVEVPTFLPDHPVVRNDLLDYAVEIEWFDSHLGRMIRLLETLGQLDNTLIIVTADNGMPFPRAKANLYEFGIHAPMAVRWGNEIE